MFKLNNIINYKNNVESDILLDSTAFITANFESSLSSDIFTD